MTRGVILPAPLAPVTVADIAIPEPNEGEVLVKMEACGICHSDLFIAAMEKPPRVPLVLGHEGIGRVEKCGPGAGSLAPGDRVGITFLAATCGACEWCSKGLERFCPRQLNSGYTAAGALAGFACVRAQHLVRVPDSLDAAVAAPLCCAGWTAYHAVCEAGLQPGGTLGVFGLGGLGHLAVQYARHAGLRVAAVDTSEEKLLAARETGAEITVPAENAGRSLQKDYGGVDAALVLTASTAAIAQALRSLKRCGLLVLVGLARGSFDAQVTDVVLKGLRVCGSFLGTREDLAEVFRLASLGAVLPRIGRYEIDEAPELFGRLQRGMLVGRAVVGF